MIVSTRSLARSLVAALDVAAGPERVDCSGSSGLA
jgi:hypothetical protein